MAVCRRSGSATPSSARPSRTGRPSRDWRGLLDYFEEHRDEAEIFNAAMVAKSLAVLPALVDAYDFANFDVIADIGGGRGHLLRAVLERAPQARGILFDLPHVVAEAREARSPRLEIAPGDFFADAPPSAGVYLLMDLLHDWRDDDAVRILTSVRRAAAPRARVLIIETLVPELRGRTSVRRSTSSCSPSRAAESARAPSTQRCSNARVCASSACCRRVPSTRSWRRSRSGPTARLFAEIIAH